MNWLMQCQIVTLMYLRTIPQRLGASLTAAVGVAGVVAVMVAVPGATAVTKPAASTVATASSLS